MNVMDLSTSTFLCYDHIRYDVVYVRNLINDWIMLMQVSNKVNISRFFNVSSN